MTLDQVIEKLDVMRRRVGGSAPVVATDDGEHTTRFGVRLIEDADEVFDAAEVGTVVIDLT